MSTHGSAVRLAPETAPGPTPIRLPGPRPSPEPVGGGIAAAPAAEDLDAGYPGIRYAFEHCSALRGASV